MTMKTSSRWWWGAAGVLGLALVVGCAAERSKGKPFFHQDDPNEASATHLGDPWGEGSVAEMLGTDERKAVRDAGLGFAEEQPLEPIAGAGEPESGFARRMDQAGKVGVTLLGVGLSAAAVAAPFFLF
jgi:hypothetical protein